VVAGCWSSQPLVDNTFTDEEWEQLQKYTLREPKFCPDTPEAIDCERGARLGKKLFFDPSLSLEIMVSEPSAPGANGEKGKVSCVSCHDTTKFLSDTRSQPNNISIGTLYTKHNALGLINAARKEQVADEQCAKSDRFLCRNVFSWNGQYETAGDVVRLALKKAMSSDLPTAGGVVRLNPMKYAADYKAAFGRPPCAIDSSMQPPDCDDEAGVEQGIVSAFDLYLRRLANSGSPFDRYIAGDFSALTAEAKRGLAVFIGKAMCVDCHQPPLFSDLQFHNTGVPQRGLHVVAIDGGLDDCLFDPKCPISGRIAPNDPDPHRYLGMFLVQPLRNVAETGPYMHDGVFATLAEVIGFYNNGGVADGFSGTRDPRIQPIGLTDDEAQDLESFLRSLTGGPVDPTWTTPEVSMPSTDQDRPSRIED
jgi:cytochrome c peroxidase